MSRCSKIPTPTSLVLLGATGDLAQKKLLPALFDLYLKDAMPEHFYIVAFARDERTHEVYRSFARERIRAKNPGADAARLDSFLGHIEYVQGTFDDRTGFERIKQALDAHDERIGMCTSKLFYLAVPPAFYETIFEQIAAVRLEQPCLVGEGWTRILVEKPFGQDLAHAEHLEERLSSLFREEQVYRIDHYLAKDALRNILTFRFSNALFENVWNNDYVEAVYVKVFEQFDVATRGAFFDKVGALRDVGQNHMLQMLALIAMERPDTLDAAAIREKRADVLRALRAPNGQDLAGGIVKGQYDGYRSVTNVAPGSTTETYFAVRTFVDNPRWHGVPFYLEHGKAMNENRSEITVRFRSSKYCVCGNFEPHDHPNFMRFTISPEQKITVRFWVRKPGLKYDLEPNDLVFDRAHKAADASVVIADAYEEVLYDALCGDQTLFVSNEEQVAAWAYVTTVLGLWNDVEPLPYARGSDGPDSPLRHEVFEKIHAFD